MNRTDATYYDGASAKRRAVTVSFTAQALTLVEADAVLARWAYPDIRRHDAPDGMLRVRSLAAPELARLDIEDEGLAAEIRRRCPRLDEGAPGSRKAVRKAVAWSLAAAASVVLTAVFLVPLAADRLAPLVPVSVEKRVGGAVDAVIRRELGGSTCNGAEGQAALAALSVKLNDAARLTIPAEIAVLRSDVVNAVALPGGRVYILDGLLQKAESVDEVAGVLAHEFGHEAHRDGMRMILRSGGSSFLLGLLFGDVTGAGAVVWVSRILLNSAHSREVEAEADAFAAELMTALGRSPKPMGALLVRATGRDDNVLPGLLRSHPVTADRVAALEARDVTPTGMPLLTDAQWQALKSICKQP